MYDMVAACVRWRARNGVSSTPNQGLERASPRSYVLARQREVKLFTVNLERGALLVL